MNRKSDKPQLELAMMDSVGASNLKDLVGDSAELALDMVLSEGVGRDIPVIGSLMKFHSFQRSVRDQLFAKKVLAFLTEIAESDNARRARLADEILSSKGGPERAGAAVLLLLERLDDLNKPQLVGRLFKACADGKIDVDKAFRLSAYVERTYIKDLLVLARLGKGPAFTSEEKEALASAGLFVPRLMPRSESYRALLRYDPSLMDEPELEWQLSGDAKLLALLLFGAELPVYKAEV